MKIFFDNVCNNSTGPNTFARRLATEFINMGHSIADYSDYDVHLAFIEKTLPVKDGKVLVQRLDGIWFKPDDIISKNVGIKKTWDDADIVIWQSNFDMRMTKHRWGEKHGVIVHNGINLKNRVTKSTIPELQKLRQIYDRIFVCSASWHPQKRFDSNMELFRRARNSLPGKSCLVVLGNNAPMRADPDVFYAGNVPEQVYLEIYSTASWMLHLAWLDHCPNVVIEALSQGTPVVCGSSGGTHELVGGYGVVINEDDYDLEPADYDNPPKIDVHSFDVNVLLERPRGSHADISIATCARGYINAFNDALDRKR